MALDSNDLGMLHSMGFSPYEQVKIGYMQNKKASGTAIGALATAIGTGVAAIGSWFWAASQAKNAKDVAIAKNDGLRDLVTSLATTLAVERQERREGDLNITTTINDTVSGQQQGSLSQSQQLSNEIALGLMTGQYSQNPIKVVRVSGQRECGCDSCGCNG